MWHLQRHIRADLVEVQLGFSFSCRAHLMKVRWGLGHQWEFANGAVLKGMGK